jgi:hypothetical protein
VVARDAASSAWLGSEGFGTLLSEVAGASPSETRDPSDGVKEDPRREAGALLDLQLCVRLLHALDLIVTALRVLP